MKICSIASGSSGNCIYVADEKHQILIDAGVSRKRIIDGLAQIGALPQELDAIFVTHEHIDHIQGIYMMVKMFGIPVFATGGTLDGICMKDRQGVLGHDKLYQIYADETVQMGDMRITPFHISHDAAEPDLGVYDDYTVEYLEGSEILILEANHDISMLEAGKYPYPLKCRILSERGHLSNEAAGQLLCRLFHKNLQSVFLAHLSKENNYPQLAYEAVKCQVWEELGFNQLPFELQVAEREKTSKVVTLI